MKKAIAILVVSAVLCFPAMRSQATFDVEITWSLSGGEVGPHLVEFQGEQFELIESQTYSSVHRLKGGCRSALAWQLCKWGFIGQSLSVDGTEVDLGRLNTKTTTGEFHLFGLGRKKKTSVEILLNQQ